MKGRPAVVGGKGWRGVFLKECALEYRRCRRSGSGLSFSAAWFTTISVFGTPQEVLLDEISIELFYPL